MFDVTCLKFREKRKMSIKIERSELVTIARSVYNGNEEIEKYLQKRLKEGPKTAVFKKMEEKLWVMMVEQHPLKDFTGDQESKIRCNIVQRIRTVIKSKFLESLISGY